METSVKFLEVNPRILEGWHTTTGDQEVKEVKEKIIERFYPHRNIGVARMKLRIQALTSQHFYRIHIYLDGNYDGYIDWTKNHAEAFLN